MAHHQFSLHNSYVQDINKKTIGNESLCKGSECYFVFKISKNKKSFVQSKIPCYL